MSDNAGSDNKKKGFAVVSIIIAIIVFLAVGSIIYFVFFAKGAGEGGASLEEGNDKPEEVGGPKLEEGGDKLKEKRRVPEVIPSLVPKKHLKEEKEVSNLNAKVVSELKPAEVGNAKSDMLVNMGNLH